MEKYSTGEHIEDFRGTYLTSQWKIRSQFQRASGVCLILDRQDTNGQS